jgi:hypothetical protein
MQEHEYFEELSALAAIGQLSKEEHRELTLHLKECSICRQAGEEFASILDQLPAAAPSRAGKDTTTLLSESYRQRFIRKAAGEGIQFSSAAVHPNRGRGAGFSFSHRWQMGGLAAAAACLSAVATFTLASHSHKTAQLRAAQPVAQSRVSRLPLVLPLTPSIPSSASSRLTQRDTASGESRSLAAERQIRLLKHQLALAAAETDRQQSAGQALQEQLDGLRTRATVSEQAATDAGARIQKLQDDQAQLIAAIVERNNRIQALSAQVAAQTAAAERERQLNAAAKDVRELMGARNLHIIDVYDFDARQSRDKSFGRVFYAAGKELIFYAFDLGRRGESSKSSFQAWGQLEGQSKTAKSLGVFRVDDHLQKTWVLRVQNSELLSSIDSVFVTVERSPGADKPSGKKLLYAYLGSPPNHP